MSEIEPRPGVVPLWSGIVNVWWISARLGGSVMVLERVHEPATAHLANWVSQTQSPLSKGGSVVGKRFAGFRKKISGWTTTKRKLWACVVG